ATGPGRGGARPRGGAALDAAHLPRRGHARRVLPRPRRDGVRRRARQARGGAHRRALRRQPRRDLLALPGCDPRARARPPVTRTLDITDVTCPMTWVKTKLELE